MLDDIRAGKVSLQQAREVYRVALDPTHWTIDEAETVRLRLEADNPLVRE